MTVNLFAELQQHASRALFGVVTVADHTERLDGHPIDKDADLRKALGAVFDNFVVHRAVATGD